MFDDDQWLIVTAHPSEQALNQFRKNTLSAHKVKRNAKEIIQEFEPDMLKELRALVKDGQELKALKLMKEVKDISLGVSKSIIKQLKIIR